MAVDPMARRAEGVSPLPPQRGSRGKDNSSYLPVVEDAAGPSSPRGVEPNTNLRGSDSPPVITQTYGSEVPRGEVFSTPDSSGVNACGPGDDRRTTADSSAKNSAAVDIPHDAFTAMGESYPANGGLDGRT